MSRPGLCLAQVVLVIGIASCRYAAPSSPTKQLLLGRVDQLAQAISSEQVAVEQAIAASGLPGLAAIAARDPIGGSLTAARMLLGSARDCISSNFLDEDADGEDQVGRCSALLDQAESRLREPRRRIAAWVELWHTAAARAQQATESVNAARARVDDALRDGAPLATRVAIQIAAYPGKQLDLEQRAAQLRAAPPELDRRLAPIDREAVRIRDRDPQADVAVFERALRELEDAVAAANTSLTDLAERLTELDVDDQLVLTRLEKTTVRANDAFFATARSARNGLLEPEVRAEIDAATFARYLMIATGLQAAFPGEPVVTTRPVPGPTAICQAQLDVAVSVVLAHKAVGEYDVEASGSPSPAGLALGHIGNQAYGAWFARDDGRQAWQWGDAWTRAYPLAPQLPAVSDEAYARYSAWRYDNALVCDYDRAGVYLGGKLARSGCQDGRPASDPFASCPRPVGSIRGVGPSTRSRGMGGGGK